MVRDSAQTILCYGDSNTWGAIPGVFSRHPRNVRWPVVLQSLLGDHYEVLSEGLPGRTFAAADPASPHKVGVTHLKAILQSAHPISYLIIMLGTNDQKDLYNLEPQEIASHLEATITLARETFSAFETYPTIVVVCPPPIIKPASGLIDPKFSRCLGRFEALPLLFKTVCEKSKCTFINAGDLISSSEADGYHLDDDAHKTLAEAVCKLILQG